MTVPAAPLHVRRAETTDAGAVADTWLRSRRAAIPDIPPPAHDDNDVRAWVAKVVVPSLETWLVEQGGTCVAMMALSPGWVEQLYVDPAHVGRGIGARLVELAKARSPEGLDCRTFQSNTRARRFYERHGFQVVATTEGDNEEGAPDVRYHWPGAAGR